MIEIGKLNKLTNYHLIIAATNLEVSNLTRINQTIQQPNTPYFKISENIDCIITGIGQYNTVKAITHHISLYGKPTSMINIGIAGAYDNKLKLTSLVKVEKDIAYDQIVINNSLIQNWQEAGLPNSSSNIFTPIKTSYDN